jgi:hypothetical protein
MDTGLFPSTDVLGWNTKLTAKISKCNSSLGEPGYSFFFLDSSIFFVFSSFLVCLLCFMDTIGSYW